MASLADLQVLLKIVFAVAFHACSDVLHPFGEYTHSMVFPVADDVDYLNVNLDVVHEILHVFLHGYILDAFLMQLMVWFLKSLLILLIDIL